MPCFLMSYAKTHVPVSAAAASSNGAGSQSPVICLSRCTALRAHLSVTRHDALEPHGLDHEQLERFREQLASLSTIGRAWLVRKQQRSADGIPLYVVLVRLRGMILREQAVVQGIVDRIELPGSVVVVTTKDSRGLVRNIRETAESPCWQRS